MSWLSKGLKKIERGISNAIPHTHSAERRAQMQATKEQMDYYHDAKEIAHKQADELSKQKDLEREKINQKQIRALRRNIRRPGGFMGTDSDVKTTLG